MDNVITYWFSLIQAIVSSFFSYQIVPGVTFGWFILAVMILGLIISFVFRNIVG